MKTYATETNTATNTAATQQAAQLTAPNGAGAAQFGSDRMWGLKELPLPDAVSYWPQTTGWLIVALLLLLLSAVLAWRLRQRWQRNAYRRDALNRLQAMLSADTDLTQLPFLLRAAALKAGPRRDVASLRGQAWIDWLNHSAGKTVFQPQDADMIDRLPYLAPASVTGLVDANQRQHLIDASITWVKEHRVSV